MSEKFNSFSQPQDNVDVEKKLKQDNPIVKRIVESVGIPGLVDALKKMPNTDFQSLFLKVMEEKSEIAGVADINATLERNSFVRTSSIDQREFLNFDSVAYNVLPSVYKGVELSSLVPFATNKVLANINQKRILSTTRNAEIISDPTTALALYCAQERLRKTKENPRDTTLVALATSQRVIRQDSIKKEGYNQHFRTFTLAIAGRDVGFEKFEKENLREHLHAFLSLIRILNESGGYEINDVVVTISDVSHQQGLIEAIDADVIENLRKVFSEVTFVIDHERTSHYYTSLCYSISAKNKERKPISIAGGGITAWTEKLVGSRKERLLVGSIGSETICRHFKK